MYNCGSIKELPAQGDPMGRGVKEVDCIGAAAETGEDKQGGAEEDGQGCPGKPCSGVGAGHGGRSPGMGVAVDEQRVVVVNVDCSGCKSTQRPREGSKAYGNGVLRPTTSVVTLKKAVQESVDIRLVGLTRTYYSSGFCCPRCKLVG